ncbi:unnamed protein product [Acanthoscelides obtectus]|uniref:Uncharacterized protein n=1 Tax=Acanthoscelides obtectus TaxID=200917 RepID=A0A9P0L5Z6_ACAOB|nr:unnamed protein product [Acanthoscelides obtectus]CAK1659829.1 Leucine-rich repeat-containing protein 74B [Acanthoscelides obtectus]
MDDQEREQQRPQSDFDDEFGEDGLNFDDIAEADMLDFTRECKDSQTLLLKNTWSFRCLAQVQLSHSSLMRNIAFLFPPLEDPGIDAVFDYAEPDPTYDDIGVEKYINLCKDLEIVPISRVTRSLTSPILNLKFYGLSEKQIRAISETLKGNAYIEHLILQDNWLTPEMTDMLSSMLQENGALRVLTLRECRIGQSGAEKLNEALSSSQFLSELDLSFNSLGDKGLKLIQVGLCETTSLKKLNISHNELTEESGETLEKILVENKTITDIDLSWNGFYTLPGNKKLFNGFKNNDRIKWLSLAWNGISTKGAISPLTKYLRTATSLEYLDLDANRLSHGPLKMLVNAVNKNHSLVTLRIGNNPYPADEGLILLKMLASKGRDPLTFMDMENTYLPKSLYRRVHAALPPPCGRHWSKKHNCIECLPSVSIRL